MNRHLDRGHFLYQLGRLEEAANEFALAARSSDTEYPADADAMLALLELQQGQPITKARYRLFMARARDPESPVIHVVAGLFAQHEEDHDLARRDFAALRAASPSDVCRIGICARHELVACSPAAALRLALEGLAVDPADEDCLEIAAAACITQADTTLAEDFVSRLLAVAPASFDAHLLRARLALLADNVTVARRHTIEALRLAPARPEAHLALHACATDAHPVARLLKGWIGSWCIPGWLRFAVFILPLFAYILLGFPLDREPFGPGLERITNPFFLFAAWFAAYLGWGSWFTLWRACRDPGVRRSTALNRDRLLVSGLPATLLTLLLAAYLFLGFPVAGAAFSGAFLTVLFYVCVSHWRERVLRPACLGSFVAVFFTAVWLQIAAHLGVSWASPSLLGLVLVILAVLLVVGVVIAPKQTAQPPPLPTALP